MDSGMLVKDAADLLDRLGRGLSRVTRAHDQLGFDAVECALLYSTTPSLPSSTGPSPCTGMIEWTFTPGAIGVADSALINRLEGSMLSSAVGITNGVPIRLVSRSLPSATTVLASPPGKFKNLLPNLTMGLLAI